MVVVSLNLREVNWGPGFIWSFIWSFIWDLAGLLLLAAFIGKFAAGFFIREPRRNQMVIGLS